MYRVTSVLDIFSLEKELFVCINATLSGLKIERDKGVNLVEVIKNRVRAGCICLKGISKINI